MRHDGPHIGNLQQLLWRGIQNAVQLAKVARQCLGRGFTNVANAQTEQKPWQRGPLRFFQRIHDILCGLVGHTVQRGQRGEPQTIQVWQGLDDVCVHQLIHQLVAQAFHLHRATLGKVQDGLLALGAAKQATGTAVVSFIFFAHRSTAADRAFAGHGEHRCIGHALVDEHRHHFGNHITGTAHNDRVTHAHVLAAGFVFVV